MTYYEWIQTINLLKTSPMDEQIITNLENKTIDNNEYVINRLFLQTIKMINTRLNNSGLKCLKQIKETNLNFEVLSMNLINLKKEKQYVLKISKLSVFDAKTKTQIVDIINKVYNDIINVIKKIIKDIDETGEYFITLEKIISS